MKKIFIIISIFIITFSLKIYSQETKSYINIQIEGENKAITGNYKVEELQWARIENPQLPEKASIGLLTDPPNKKLPFDIAFIVANMSGGEIIEGEYQAIKVIGDIPQFELGKNEGFMTIVVNNSSIPRNEYYTSEGKIKINKIEGNNIYGEFDVTLISANDNSIIYAKGIFRIVL